MKFKFKSGDTLITIEARGHWQARNLLGHIIRDKANHTISIDAAAEQAKAFVLINADKLFLGMTEEQFKRFYSACNATLNGLAPDLLPEGTSLPRKQLVEVVLDADYVRMYGERRPRSLLAQGQPWPEFYDTVIRPWITKHYGTPAFYKVMALVFTHSRYSA